MKYYVFCLQDFFVEDLKIILRKNKAYYFHKEEFERSLSLRDGLFLKKLKVTPIVDRKENSPKEIEVEKNKIEMVESSETKKLLEKILKQLEVISSQLERQPQVLPQTKPPQKELEKTQETPLPSFLPTIGKNNSSIEIKEKVSNSSNLKDSLRELRKKNAKST